MAALANGQFGTDGRSDPSFQQLRGRKRSPYAIDRYVNEVNRLYGVMNKRLQTRDFLAGDYSIADMAAYPWVRPYKRQNQVLSDFPALEAWFVRIHDRPATARAVLVGKEEAATFDLSKDKDAQSVLFGQRAR